MKRSSPAIRHRPEQPGLRMGLNGKDALRMSASSKHRTLAPNRFHPTRRYDSMAAGGLICRFVLARRRVPEAHWPHVSEASGRQTCRRPTERLHLTAPWSDPAGTVDRLRPWADVVGAQPLPPRKQSRCSLSSRRGELAELQQAACRASREVQRARHESAARLDQTGN